MCEKYDVIIIGGGPAGYTAGLYAVRAGLKSLIIEKMFAGGQMTETMHIDNYPGFEEGIDGYTLGMKMKEQAEHFGLVTENAEVISVDLKGDVKIVNTSDKVLHAKSVIIATGAKHKHLGLRKEEEYIGRGVGYCASCDGMLYKGKTVVVVGGGNSAVADASLLSNICDKVIVVHRRDEFRAAKISVDALKEQKNIIFCLDNQVTDLIGDKRLESVKIKNAKTGEEQLIECQGLFISIGRTPETDIFKGQVEMDNNGYIIASEDTKTNIEGVYVAGDVRTKPFRQIVTAVADGAIAVHYVEEYLKK